MLQSFVSDLLPVLVAPLCAVGASAVVPRNLVQGRIYCGALAMLCSIPAKSLGSLSCRGSGDPGPAAPLHDRLGLDWIDRWEQSGEECPGCGLTCEHEDAPRATVDPDDPALDDERVAQFSWYHTSAHPDWPAKDFDPAASLTAETRLRMGGDEHVARGRRASARRLSTSARTRPPLHNMLRWMDHQADSRSQFCLHRVHIEPSVVVREGRLIDPSDWLDDVVLAEVCPPGIDVARYLNYHQDPGGLSMALDRNAIAGVQQIAIPLPEAWDGDWVRGAVAVLDNASDAAVPAKDVLGRYRPGPSRRATVGHELGQALAGRVALNRLFRNEGVVLGERGFGASLPG